MPFGFLPDGAESFDQLSSESATELAEKVQNPLSDLISLPFQNNANFRFGPNKGTRDILNIQPVIPIHITPDWNVITRTIPPFVWNPSLQAQTVPFGTSPTSFSAWLSPKNPVDGWVWGVGPVVQIPTISNKSLGSNVWGAGPTVILVKRAPPWVAGVLANNAFSFGGTTAPGGTKYKTFFCTDLRELQPWRRVVRRLRAHHHGELACEQRQVGVAGGRPFWPADQDRGQAAG